MRNRTSPVRILSPVVLLTNGIMVSVALTSLESEAECAGIRLCIVIRNRDRREATTDGRGMGRRSHACDFGELHVRASWPRIGRHRL